MGRREVLHIQARIHFTFSLFHSNPPAVSVRSQERHGGPEWGWGAGSRRVRGGLEMEATWKLGGQLRGPLLSCTAQLWDVKSRGQAAFEPGCEDGSEMIVIAITVKCLLC